jgi:hypothetical protein
MFDQLFVRSDALTRYLSAPLIEERRQYLTHCAVQGMTKSTLEAKARLQLSIAEYLRLAERPSDTISLSEIKKAATRWSNHNWPSPQSSHAKRSREYCERYVNHILREALGQAKYAFAELIISLLASCRC